MARKAPAKPLTVDHFVKWASLLVLDSGDYWHVEPFQRDIAAEILRGTDEVFVDIPEGCGKSTLLGGFALYHASYVEGAMVPMAAASRDQTMVLLGQAAGFVYRTAGLARRFEVQLGHRRILALATHGLIQVFAAEAKTGDGVIPTLALVDELHRHPDLHLYRTWRGKLGKRGGQIVSISVAGEPGGEYETVKANILKRSKVTCRGARTIARAPGIVLHQFALQDGDDIHDLKAVKRANPFSGVTMDVLTAKHDSPTMLDSHWSRFVCGIPTRTAGAAVTALEWNALPKTEIPAGESVWCGLDLGWKWDTTAAVPLWMPGDDRRVFGRPEVVVPPRDGTSTPPAEIRAALRRVHARTPIHTVVLDPNAGGEQLVEWIESPEGLGAEVVVYGQTNQPQALAFEKFMESIREGLTEHPHDPVLTQQVLNAVAKPVLSDRLRFDRPSTVRQARGQEQRVIDCLSAASSVLAVATADVEDDAPILIAARF